MKYYLRFILFLFSLFIFTFSFSQTVPEFQINWAQLGYNNGQLTPGLTAKDFDGNLYALTMVKYNTSVTIGGTTVSGGNVGVAAIIKYDSNQNPIWIKEIPFSARVFNNIAPHKFLFHNGSLYFFVAYYQNNITMDGINFPPFQAPQGAGDLVLIKINTSTLKTDWIRFMARPGCFSTIPPDNFEIYFDKNDKIHAVGTFSNKLIPVGSNDTLVDESDTAGVNAFHIVYDTTGNLISANDLGIINENPNYYAYEYFSVDNQNNIYRFVKDTKTFIKYDSQGDILFSKQFSSSGGLTITGMQVDPWYNVVLSGYFTGSSMSFDGISASKAGGSTDGVLIKFNSNNGNVEWLKTSQDSDCDRYDFISMDALGNIYVLSKQYGWCLSPGYSMVAKYNPNGDILYKSVIDGDNLPNATQIAMIRSYNMSLSPSGGNIIISGQVKYGQNNQKGFVMQLGICNTSNPTVHVYNSNICKGEQATLSVDSLPNYHYLWSNGDTTSTIQVDESGRYSVVAIQNDECYSKSKGFYINVHPLPYTNVSIQNNILTATEASSGITYQWIDCQNNDLPISGATNQTFAPIQNGKYAVVLTSINGCSDTSSCYTINTLGIKNNPALDKQITLYPNPTSDKINVRTDLEITKVYVLDLQGRKLQTSNSKEVNLSNLSSGIYLIKVKLKNNKIWTSKVIKK